MDHIGKRLLSDTEDAAIMQWCGEWRQLKVENLMAVEFSTAALEYSEYSLTNFKKWQKYISQLFIIGG